MPVLQYQHGEVMNGRHHDNAKHSSGSILSILFILR